MTVQFSVPVRNKRADAVETEIGASAILEIRTGAQPATCATADSGTLLASCALPADWMANAASGVKALLGTWQDTSANNAGNAGHYRIKDTGGTTCGMQGSVTATGGGGDMTLDNIVFAAGQAFVVTAFSITEGNA